MLYAVLCKVASNAEVSLIAILLNYKIIQKVAKIYKA